MKEMKKEEFYLSLDGALLSLFFIHKSTGYKYVDGVKNYSDYSPNPLIILPLIAGTYGGFLKVRKAFKLAKQFEKAE